MEFTARLRGLRAEKRMRQDDVAAAIGLSVSGYKKIEYGESSPTLKTLISLAEFYGVSLDYLTGRSENRSRT